MATWDRCREWLLGCDVCWEKQGPWTQTPDVLGPRDGSPYPYQDHFLAQSSTLGRALSLHWTLRSHRIFSLREEQMSCEGLNVWQRNQHGKMLGSSENLGQDPPPFRPPWSAFCIHGAVGQCFVPLIPWDWDEAISPLVGISALSWPFTVSHCTLSLLWLGSLWISCCFFYLYLCLFLALILSQGSLSPIWLLPRMTWWNRAAPLHDLILLGMLTWKKLKFHCVFDFFVFTCYSHWPN